MPSKAARQCGPRDAQTYVGQCFSLLHKPRSCSSCFRTRPTPKTFGVGHTASSEDALPLSLVSFLRAPLSFRYRAVRTLGIQLRRGHGGAHRVAQLDYRVQRNQGWLFYTAINRIIHDPGWQVRFTGPAAKPANGINIIISSSSIKSCSNFTSRFGYAVCMI